MTYTLSAAAKNFHFAMFSLVSFYGKMLQSLHYYYIALLKKLPNVIFLSFVPIFFFTSILFDNNFLIYIFSHNKFNFKSHFFFNTRQSTLPAKTMGTSSRTAIVNC